MNSLELLNELLCLNEDVFDMMKTLLLERFVKFSFYNDTKEIAKEMIFEKLNDYIEKVSINTGKSFDELIDYYMEILCSLVEMRLKKKEEVKNVKDEKEEQDTRAYKYFSHAKKKREKKEKLIVDLDDFSRIIFCLYNEIINNEYQSISDFDLSFKSVDCSVLLNALENEKKEEKKIFMFTVEGESKKFDLTKKYSKDEFIFVMLILIYYRLRHLEVRSEF